MVETHILHHLILVQLKPYIHIFEGFNSSHRRVLHCGCYWVWSTLFCSTFSFILPAFTFSFNFSFDLFLYQIQDSLWSRFLLLSALFISFIYLLIIINIIYFFCSFTLHACYFSCLTLNLKFNLFHFTFIILIESHVMFNSNFQSLALLFTMTMSI